MIPCRGCNDTGQNGAALSTDACSNVAVRANTPIHGGEIPALRLRETPTTVKIAAGDILEIAMERGGLRKATVVPYEASAALSMLLLRDYGMLMVHFVGVPPGTADLLIKFVPPETLERFGGVGGYAEAVNSSLTRLGELLRDRESIRELLLGKH
jgi:L-seryl-tRNA(Ser) seleniumtransferase